MAVINSLSTVNEPIEIVSGTGTMLIGNDATVKTITIGSNTGSSPITIQSGTGGITITGRNITVGGSTGTSALTIQAGTGGMTFSGPVQLGSTTGVSATTLQCGTGALNISATTGSSFTVSIGNTTGATSVVFSSGTGGINIATNGTATDNITLGNSSQSNTIILQCGTGGITYPAASVSVSGTCLTGLSYVATSASLITFTPPANPPTGAVYRFNGLGTGKWRVAQNANQVIKTTANTTTVGATGHLDAGGRYDCAELQFVGSNTFIIRSFKGTLSFT